MRLFRFSLVVAAGASLLGCVPSDYAQYSASRSALPTSIVAQSKASILGRLKDPDSALFRNEAGFVTSRGDQIVCGEYNAKNSYGGYVGYTAYYFRYVDGKQLGDLRGGRATQACEEARSGSIALPTT